MRVQKSEWPYGKLAAFCLGVDDIHPESSKDDEGIDFGGDMDHGNFKYLNELVEKYPYLKTNLFVVADWIARPVYPFWKFISKLDPIVSPFGLRSPALVKSARTTVARRRSYREGTFRLDLDRYRTWCDWLRSKVQTGNFEVVPHGLFHISENSCASTEFADLSPDEMLRRLIEMKQIFDNTKIPFVNGFRPPGWDISWGLLEILDKLEYRFFAGFFDSKSQLHPLGDRILPVRYDNYSFVSITANCNMQTFERAFDIIELGGLVLFQTHIMSSCFGLERVSKKFVRIMSRLLDMIEKKYPDQVWFATLGEIADEFGKGHSN